MNIFGLSLEEVQAEAKTLEGAVDIDLLPGIPAILSLSDAAHVLAVSVQTIERIVERGGLIPDINGDIPKAVLIGYIKSHALADIPVLEDEN
jgi:hypothetical protein